MASGIGDRSATRNHPGATYEIRVEGELDESWQEWFSSLTVAIHYSDDQPPLTTITAAVADQAALRGMLCRLWDLNLTVVSVSRIDREGRSG
jgi:hypothetical protein